MRQKFKIKNCTAMIAQLTASIQDNSATSQEKLFTFESFKEFIRSNFLEGSHIHPELFKACVEFHSDIECEDGGEVAAPIHEVLGWDYKRFRQQANQNIYAAFLKNEDGSIWQAIVSIWDEEKKRPYRYFAPKGIGDRAFLPPVAPEVRERIKESSGLDVPMEGSFWEWVRTNPDAIRVVTEGAKKALRGLSDGLITIAMYGCSCGVESKDEHGSPIKPILKPDFKQFADTDTFWILALDRDEKKTTQIKVAAAKKRLKNTLNTYGCLVADMAWKNEQGKGMDDLNREDLKASYEKAIANLEKQLSGENDFKIPKADIISEQLAEYFGEKLLWNNEHKCWRLYNDATGLWESKDDHYIEHAIQVVLASKGIRGYGGDSYIVNIRKFLSRHLCAFVWGERRGVLPFEDGVVDIATGKFEEHSPGNRLTWCLPRKYNISIVEDWGAIRNWMNEAWENPTDKEKLLCFAAAVIRKRYDLQKFLYLVGSGGSGKGTFSRLLSSVIGDRNTWSGKIEQLSDKNDAARLLDKPLAIFPDQDKVTGGLQLFKNLTGGDELTGKRLYKDGFNFRYEGLCLITANAPALLSAGSWIKRRAVIVNCNYQPKQQRDLDKEFQGEIAAFTRYLLSIPNERIDAVLRDENSSNNDIDPAFWEMATRTDSIAAWLEECVVFEELAFTQTGKNKNEWADKEYTPDMSTLFGSYHHFCKGAGLQGKSVVNFSPELEELCQKVLNKQFVKRDRTATGMRGFRGIRLRKEHEKRISELSLTNSDNVSTNSRQCSDKLTDKPEPLQNKESDKLDKLSSQKPFQKNEIKTSLETSPPETKKEEYPPHPHTPINPETNNKRDKVCQSLSSLSEPLQNKDSDLSGSLSVPLSEVCQNIVGGSSQLKPGQKVIYVGSDRNHRKQYEGILEVHIVKEYGISCFYGDGQGLTTWLQMEDLQISP